MERRITIYLTAGHANVAIADGAERQTTARTLSEVMENMQVRDREVLVRLAQAIVRFDQVSDAGNALSLNQQIDPTFARRHMVTQDEQR